MILNKLRIAAAALALGLFIFSSPDYGQTMTPTRNAAVDDRFMILETLNVRKEGAVLFAEIAAPPMNLLGPELVRDLVSLIQQAEADKSVQVLVFKSADPDYFISHVDVTRVNEYRQEAAKLTGEASIGLLFRHLSASRLVTIAQIEGRVRGAGSEFVLACDMRFAARESAIFGQPTANFGSKPKLHKPVHEKQQGWRDFPISKKERIFPGAPAPERGEHPEKEPNKVRLQSLTRRQPRKRISIQHGSTEQQPNVAGTVAPVA
jgi:hypothetical protein